MLVTVLWPQKDDFLLLRGKYTYGKILHLALALAAARRAAAAAVSHAMPPPIDSIWAVMPVWRLRWKIIRIAPCCVVYDSNCAYLDTQLLQFSGLGFVTLGPFHLCLYVFCVLFYTAYVVLAYCEHGGVDLMGLKPSPLEPIVLQYCDTVGWVIWPLV